MVDITSSVIFLGGQIKTWAVKRGFDLTAKTACDYFRDDNIETSIKITTQLFPEYLWDGIETALRKWVSSEEFKGLLESTKEGERYKQDKDVISAFIALTGFDAEDQTNEIVEDLLKRLNQAILESLLNSTQGHALQEARAETRHLEVCKEIQSIKELVSLKDTPSNPIPESEKEYNVRITVAKELVEQGLTEAAEKLLQELREAIKYKSPSPQLQFKILTNLAACKQLQGNAEAAYGFIDIAYELEPENKIAISNKSLSYILKDDSNGAYEFTRQQDLNKENASVVGVYLRSAKHTSNEKVLEEFKVKNPWIFEDKECLISLAQNATDESLYDDAEFFLRRANELFPEDALILTKIGNLLLLEVQEASFPPWKIPTVVRSKVTEAEELLSKAIQILEKKPHKYLMHLAYANRAGANKFLGKYRSGLNDCDKALELDPQDDISFQNKGLILLMLDQYEDAIKAFESIQREEVRYDISLALSDVYIATKQPKKAISIIEPMLHSHLEDSAVLSLAGILMRAYTLSNKGERIESVLELLQPIWSEAPEYFKLLALKESLEGRRENAILVLEESIERFEDSKREGLLLELGHLYYRTGNYKKAVEAYRPIIDTTRDNPLLRNYLISLYYSMNYKETLYIAEAIRANGEAIPTITEIEAAIYESINNLVKAKELLLMLFEIEPKNYSLMIRVAYLEFRLGNKEAAINIVKNIPFEEIKNDPNTLVDIARIRVLLGLPNYLEFAYRARRLDFDNPKTHTIYFGLCMHLEQSRPEDKSELDEELLDFPAEIKADCTVILRNGNEKKIVTILEKDDDLINSEAGDIKITDEFSQILLGLKKGDVVVLREGPIEKLSYVVEEILSKYTYAFQKIFSEFATMFPSNDFLHKMEIEDNDFSLLFQQFDERHKLVKKALQFYESNSIPLGVFSKFVGASLIEVWQDLTTSEDSKFVCFMGNYDTIGILEENDIVVLDVTSVLTLNLLGLFDEFLSLPIRRVMPQSLLDELSEIIASYHEKRPRRVMGKNDKGYFSIEVAPEIVQKEKAQHESLLNILTQAKKAGDIEITPVSYALDYGFDNYSNLGKMIGSSSMDAVLIAKEMHAKLYSDDQMLRWLSKNDVGVNGAWVFNILNLLLKTEIIDIARFNKAIVTLIKNNYDFLPISDGLLLDLLQRNQMVVNSEVDKVFVRAFKSCTDEDTIRVLAVLLAKIWSNPEVLDRHKLWILDLCLKALTKYRSGLRMIPLFKDVLSQIFGEQSKNFRIISQNITLWERHNLVRV
ncbi:MAG: hypothetical protein QE263_02105 [Vampirovibrionales bacterium]|nr:hypothetical protein [Vampirovibrionales bacterium]